MSEACVIARLAGGLGNQLFMYAFNRAMAERNAVPMKLDVTGGFKHDKTYKRTYLLSHILPPSEAATVWQSRQFPLGKQLRRLDRKLNKLLPLARRYYVEERTLGFDPDIYNFKLTRPTIFNGYWQAPQYFADLKPGMRELVQFPDYLTDPVQPELTHIKSSNSVCLAIRRYEEVPRPKHHILQIDYFMRAMAEIERHVDNPHYYVFAQNMEWARTHIKSRFPVTFAREKDLHLGALQDLYLMSQCRHYILSNSSLHWWAAWLNAAEDKTVVTPIEGWPNKDMTLASWIRIPG